MKRDLILAALAIGLICTGVSLRFHRQEIRDLHDHRRVTENTLNYLKAEIDKQKAEIGQHILHKKP